MFKEMANSDKYFLMIALVKKIRSLGIIETGT